LIQLTVARIGRPRGLRGEVALIVRTDSPERRLVAGTTFVTAPAERGPLTLLTLRHEPGGIFATFAEIADRSAAEAMRGTDLLIAAVDAEEPDAWYAHELVGLAVVLPDGTRAGTCAGLAYLGAQDALVVDQVSGSQALVPLVRALVPEVDLAGKRIVVDPPGGLLDCRPPQVG
jgi:16S rRNA processing protein RimM